MESVSSAGMQMDLAMALTAKGDQILLYIRTLRTAPTNVMNLKMLKSSAALTSPAIPLEHLPAKPSVGVWIQPQPSPS